MTEALPELNKPPLNEVVYGMGFEPIPLLKSAHLGLFWSKYYDRYQSAEDMPPLMETIPGPGLTLGGPFPTPRIWLIDETQTRLLQLQLDRIYMNWRQIRLQDEYPRFGKLHPEFVEYSNEFSVFVRELGIGELIPKRLELTYINHLVEGEGWKLPADVNFLFRPLSGNREQYQRLPSPNYIAWKGRYRYSSEVTLNVSLNQGAKKADGAPVLQLDIQALSNSEPKSLIDAQDWYKRAREAIVHAFFDLTTEEARAKLWS